MFWPVGLHLCPGDGEPLMDTTLYHHLLGGLLYLGITVLTFLMLCTIQVSSYLSPHNFTTVIFAFFVIFVGL
jgi:hypothetical protein